MMDELREIVTTAKDYGMKVTVHAHGKEGMLRAIEGGVDSIEHGTYMDKEVMRAMKKNNVYYVPTITAGRSVADRAKIDGYFPELVRPKAAEIGPKIQNTFAEAYKYGVKIAFGTDAGFMTTARTIVSFSTWLRLACHLLRPFALLRLKLLPYSE